jgi:hypothetical protein
VDGITRALGMMLRSICRWDGPDAWEAKGDVEGTMKGEIR